jgi:hypothetical protein
VRGPGFQDGEHSFDGMPFRDDDQPHILRVAPGLLRRRPDLLDHPGISLSNACYSIASSHNQNSHC